MAPMIKTTLNNLFGIHILFNMFKELTNDFGLIEIKMIVLFTNKFYDILSLLS